MGYMHEFMDAELDESSAAQSAGTVVTYWGLGVQPNDGHEVWTLDAVARSIAAIKGYRFAGAYDPKHYYKGHLYFVPRDTLVLSDASRLPISGEADLFGGVVRHAFTATKTITHPLVAPDACAPQGWSAQFAERIAKDVLLGFSAFSIEDARAAGLRMLEEGPVRLKLAIASGGTGQKTARDAAALDDALNELDADDIKHGLVVEQDLDDVTTYSVGQVRIEGMCMTYHGTQRMTANNSGDPVYGGSDLVIVKGGFDTLLERVHEPAIAAAIGQAMRYDEAVRDEFTGFFASRRNYDVAQGTDAGGRQRSGVLEQSWRVGGATPAELPALRAFLADPALEEVRASSVEVYGDCDPPPQAIVMLRGVDPQVGLITKYGLIDHW
jgi:hypothetical protein